MVIEWDTMVSVGRVARAHGNRGRVVVNPDTDFAEERFCAGNVVYLRDGDRIDRLLIEDVRFHRHRPIVRFATVETMDAAEQLASAELRVPVDVLERLPDDTFYYHELIGCRVETIDGTVVGVVCGVEGAEGLHRLIVEDGQAEVQIPMVEAICRQIDAVMRLITIDPPEGLLDLNRPPRRSARTSRRA